MFPTNLDLAMLFMTLFFESVCVHVVLGWLLGDSARLGLVYITTGLEARAWVTQSGGPPSFGCSRLWVFECFRVVMDMSMYGMVTVTGH